ncbi:MAG: hypothetical protein LBM08_05625 [Dysgonamonadaceae bacterium]|jgi:hypothetical protein|nr:hypothetical protein [Dysgonamonadaceae bacterium]
MNDDSKEQNVAYTAQYQERLKELEHVFEVEPQQFIQKHVLGDNEYFVEIKCYLIDKRGEDGVISRTGVSKTLVTNAANETVLEIKSAYEDQFVNLVKHRNGKDYLVYRKDLYGYSIYDVADKKSVDYFPKESLDGGETFIWCSVKYCAVNDVLAVQGCYWACPYGFIFYDFSAPMEVPLKLLTDKYYTGFDHSVIAVEFTEKGECELTVSKTEQMIVDVRSPEKQHE